MRADYIGGDIYPATKTRLEWFNPLAFARPADGTLGSTPKGFVRGPGINQWDISLFKNSRVGDRVNVQFRLETFNTFNNEQFNDIFTAISTSMPATAPGSLAPQQYLDIVTYLLQQNSFPAGKEEIKADPALLKTITVTKQK